MNFSKTTLVMQSTLVTLLMEKFPAKFRSLVKGASVETFFKGSFFIKTFLFESRYPLTIFMIFWLEWYLQYGYVLTSVQYLLIRSKRESAEIFSTCANKQATSERRSNTLVNFMVKLKSLAVAKGMLCWACIS